LRPYGLIGKTHAFLPMRNGIRPNTLHVGLHAPIIAIIAILAVLDWGRPG
jgi:hypothetical protein